MNNLNWEKEIREILKRNITDSLSIRAERDAFIRIFLRQLEPVVQSLLAQKYQEAEKVLNEFFPNRMFIEGSDPSHFREVSKKEVLETLKTILK